MERLEPMTIEEISCLSDDEARAYLERLRWPEGPVCPHCGGSEATRFRGKSTRAGLFKCRNRHCREQFSVTVGTILTDLRRMRIWLQAVCLMCSRWGVSAHALHRELGI